MIALASTVRALRSELRAYIALEAGERAAKVAIAAEIDWLREQIAAKDAAILELRREGFDLPKPEAPYSAPNALPDIPQEVRTAIEEVSLPGDPLWLELMGVARKEVREGKSEDEVAAMIRRGSTVNPFHA